jgi:hypothetical protein
MSDLSEYLKLKYLGNCKCGECQLVPMKVLNEAIALRAELLNALRAQEELASLRMPGDPETNIAKVRAIRRAAIAKAEGQS